MNIQTVLIVFLLIAGIAKLNLYHASLLIIFIWSTFYPQAFQRYSVWVLIYCECFIILKYVYTLITHVEEPKNERWLTVVGIFTPYNPDETREFWRYSPRPVNWILVFLMFVYYRRSNIIGSDLKKVEEYQARINKGLEQQYPTLGRIWQYTKIVFNHIIVLLTFLILALIFGIAR